MKAVDPSKIVRIEQVVKPTARRHGEGYYELRWAHKPKDVFYHDIMTIEKEINKLMPGRGEDLVDRIYNFGKLYLNLATGEVTT